MDLVVFIIMEQVIPHQQRKFEQIFVVKREKADWRKAFKREWKILAKRTINNVYLTDISNWICGCPAFFTNRFLICKHLIQQKGKVDIEFFNQIYRHHQYPFLGNLPTYINNFESSQVTKKFDIIEVVEEEDNSQDCEELYNRFIDVMEKTLEILKDQQDKGNFKWIKSVEKNFKPIEEMLSEITVYKRRRTMPRIFKDHSHNTLYF